MVIGLYIAYGPAQVMHVHCWLGFRQMLADCTLVDLGGSVVFSGESSKSAICCDQTGIICSSKHDCRCP